MCLPPPFHVHTHDTSQQHASNCSCFSISEHTRTRTHLECKRSMELASAVKEAACIAAAPDGLDAADAQACVRVVLARTVAMPMALRPG